MSVLFINFIIFYIYNIIIHTWTERDKGEVTFLNKKNLKKNNYLKKYGAQPLAKMC